MKSRNVGFNSWLAKMSVVEQELLTLPGLLSFQLLVWFVLLDLQFDVYVLQIVVSPLIHFLLVIVSSVLLQYTDSDYPFGIFKLVLQLCLYISGKLTMFISRLCLLFLICKGVVSFVRLPCLTNESKDFEVSQKALTSLESYLETTFKTINQKIKTLNKDLQMLQDDFKSLYYVCFYIIITLLQEK